MYPPILVFRPDLAKAMLGYRIQGIGEAQQRAAEGGYQGARYDITIPVMFCLINLHMSTGFLGRVHILVLR